MVQEMTFIRKFLGNLGFPQTVPTQVFADNETMRASRGLKAPSVELSVPSMSIVLFTRLAQVVI